MSVKHLLGSDAQLMVRLLPTQLVKCLFTCIETLKIKVNGVKYLVISNAAFNHIILLMRQSFTASCDVVEPFTIVGFKHLTTYLRYFIGEFVHIHNGIFNSTNEALSVISSLLLQGSKVKTYPKVQMLTRMENIRLFDDEVRCVIESHTVFRSPFLFIKSTRSSTMYSRENVCNTS